MDSEVAPGGAFDVVLSSGFLAFGRHIGFLRAVDEIGIPVTGVCGTSSGALAGALWAAGVSTEQMTKVFHVPRPITKLRVSRTPWRGLFSLGPMVEQLEHLLPGRLEDFSQPFGVGVTNHEGQHVLLTKGPTIPSLLASCAVPLMMESVRIGDENYRDGGVVDRVGLEAWRAHRGDIPVCVHLVERSMGPPSLDLSPSPHTRVVTSPRSRAKLWSLGPYHHQIEESFNLAITTLKTRAT